MIDAECIKFLQWALPQLSMRWPGFRRVHQQVCKRLQRRIVGLALSGFDDYRDYLEIHPAEWQVLDGLCQITVSRFYRDRRLFETLEHTLLPDLARQAIARGTHRLRLWSAGCASGEEPYTLSLLWQQGLATRFPTVEPQILATDINPQLLQRATRACYPFSAIKNLPPPWRAAGFITQDRHYCLRPEFRRGIEFRQHDVRTPPPAGPFDLILCRNLAFTYYTPALQHSVLAMLGDRLRDHGVLVIGVHEHLPEEATGFTPYAERYGIYLKAAPIPVPLHPGSP